MTVAEAMQCIADDTPGVYTVDETGSPMPDGHVLLIAHDGSIVELSPDLISLIATYAEGAVSESC